ncbi:GTPase Obg [bacterium BMS3Bbin02]|nr:GTPase Obg [bacterium BMS3Bbin02]
MALFVDKVRISIKGGAGGAGVASFVREKGLPRGKPNGGSGGSGGDVILRATHDVASLISYSRHPHWRASDGTHGEGDLRNGAAGEDRILLVPLGTRVVLDDGTVIADLVKHDTQITLARGGRGGRGNAAFMTPRRKAPSFCEQGEYGDELWVTLELRLLADAALIGFPNAGKSTLISRVSAAKPKIADYPFTTLTPNLGMVRLEDREFLLADIPGIIEGASVGKGLGHEFLRHVERARVLVVLLDPTPLQSLSVGEQYVALLRELAGHDETLASRTQVVVVNKMDSVSDPSEIEAWAAELGIRVHLISAIAGTGLTELIHVIADRVAEHIRKVPEREGFVLHRPLEEGFAVGRDENTWVVSGKAATRAINLSDLTVPEAADFAAKRLKFAGIEDALVEAGAVSGDDVRIGDVVFVFAGDTDDVEDDGGLLG